MEDVARQLKNVRRYDKFVHGHARKAESRLLTHNVACAEVTAFRTTESSALRSLHTYLFVRACTMRWSWQMQTSAHKPRNQAALVGVSADTHVHRVHEGAFRAGSCSRQCCECVCRVNRSRRLSISGPYVYWGLGSIRLSDPRASGLQSSIS